MLLIFNKENKDIFDAIKQGKKKVETRAATKKYQNIKTGDTLTFLCDGEKFEMKAQEVRYYKTIEELLAVYKPADINPKMNTKEEIVSMYKSFPGYESKINEFGIIAITLY